MSAGIIWLILLVVYNWRVLTPLYRNGEEPRTEIMLNTMQILLLLISLQNIFVQSERFRKGTPVSLIYQGMAWFIACKYKYHFLMMEY